MKRAVYLIRMAIGILLFCGIGCAGSRATKVDVVLVEEFDPEVLNDDDISVRPDLPLQTPSSEEASMAAEEPKAVVPERPDTTKEDEPPVPETLIPGYRIQIATTLKRDSAERLKEEIASRLNVRAYVEYAPSVSPFYKIRIGNCRTKKEAEELRRRAEDAGYTVSGGYSAPFWVETMVLPVEPVEPTVQRVQVQGYRVQLVAVENREEVNRVKEEAERKFDVEVYREFVAPLYKVRIGDCQTVEEADMLLREARRKGYGDAFRIRTKIWIEQGEVGTSDGTER